MKTVQLFVRTPNGSIRHENQHYAAFFSFMAGMMSPYRRVPVINHPAHLRGGKDFRTLQAGLFNPRLSGRRTSEC